MASILQKLINQKITYKNNNSKTYQGQLPIFIKEIKFNDLKERNSILRKIQKLKYELEMKIIDYIEENEKIYILFFENEDIINSIFELKEEIIEEGYVEGHSGPLRKTEINNIFEKELSLCKIHFKKKNNNIIENAVGTGFFCRMNLSEIPFKLALFTNNHVLDRNSIKKGKDIIFDYKDKPSSKIIEISEKRRVFTSEELDYTCVEIFEKDNIFKNNEIEKLFKIDQNILEENSSNNNNVDILILQYPKGNEISLSSGKIKCILGNEIYHTATTVEGSSGSPIILRDNYSIIGLHFGAKISQKKKGLMDFNLGTNIIGIINDIKNKISKKLIKIEDNSKLEILDRKEYIKKLKENDKLNLIKFESKNFILLNSINPIFEPTPNFWSDYIIKGRFLPKNKRP